MRKSTVVYMKFRGELQSFVNDFCKKNDCDLVLLTSASVLASGTKELTTATKALDSRECGRGTTVKKLMPLLKANLMAMATCLEAVGDLLG